MNLELKIAETDDAYELTYEIDKPEGIVVNFKGNKIVDHICVGPTSGIFSYFNDVGSLDYVLDTEILPELISDENINDGYYYVDAVGSFTPGDGWTYDDDMDVYLETIRTATEDEQKELG